MAFRACVPRRFRPRPSWPVGPTGVLLWSAPDFFSRGGPLLVAGAPPDAPFRLAHHGARVPPGCSSWPCRQPEPPGGPTFTARGAHFQFPILDAHARGGGGLPSLVLRWRYLLVPGAAAPGARPVDAWLASRGLGLLLNTCSRSRPPPGNRPPPGQPLPYSQLKFLLLWRLPFFSPVPGAHELPWSWLLSRPTPRRRPCTSAAPPAPLSRRCASWVQDLGIHRCVLGNSGIGSSARRIAPPFREEVGSCRLSDLPGPTRGRAQAGPPNAPAVRLTMRPAVKSLRTQGARVIVPSSPEISAGLLEPDPEGTDAFFQALAEPDPGRHRPVTWSTFRRR